MRPASARLPSTNKPVGRGSAPRFSSYVAPSSPSSPSVGPIAPPQPVTLLGRAAAAVCNALVALSLTLGAPSPAAADGSALYDYLARKKERLVLEGRQSNLNEELFTAESWEGMTSIVNYARYVNSICEDLEKQPGCEECEDNRVILEHAWQVCSRRGVCSRRVRSGCRPSPPKPTLVTPTLARRLSQTSSMTAAAPSRRRGGRTSCQGRCGRRAAPCAASSSCTRRRRA